MGMATSMSCLPLVMTTPLPGECEGGFAVQSAWMFVYSRACACDCHSNNNLERFMHQVCIEFGNPANAVTHCHGHSDILTF